MRRRDTPVPRDLDEGRYQIDRLSLADVRFGGVDAHAGCSLSISAEVWLAMSP